MVCYTMSLVSCCCQDENDNEEMDMDSPNRFSDLRQIVERAYLYQTFVAHATLH